jgi:glycosyltransferase involved in cell wall biosynthesis
MRILYSHRIQSRDGQSVHVEELVAALRAAGHEVLVVGPSFYDHSGFGGESRAVALLRRLLPGVLGECAELAYNIPAYLRLRRAWKAFHPDLVYERNNLYFFPATLLRRFHNALFYLEVNSPLAAERSRFGNLRLQRLALALERMVWRSADRVLPVTGVLRDELIHAGVDPAVISVVPNGVVLDRYLPRDPLATDPHAPLVLGFIGFVRSWHGLDAVVTAIADQARAGMGGRRLCLTVIGDGPARAELEQQASLLGVSEQVRFTGVVEHAEVPARLSGFDIALQPKVVAYASPLKIFDYMAAGCAIVAPDQPNIREILEHERTALLFNPDDPAALWQAISRLVDDPALRQRLAVAARAELEAKDYTWHGNARRIAQWASEQARKPR